MIDRDEIERLLGRSLTDRQRERCHELSRRVFSDASGQDAAFGVGPDAGMTFLAGGPESLDEADDQRLLDRAISTQQSYRSPHGAEPMVGFMHPAAGGMLSLEWIQGAQQAGRELAGREFPAVAELVPAPSEIHPIAWVLALFVGWRKGRVVPPRVVPLSARLAGLTASEQERWLRHAVSEVVESNRLEGDEIDGEGVLARIRCDLGVPVAD